MLLPRKTYCDVKLLRHIPGHALKSLMDQYLMLYELLKNMENMDFDFTIIVLIPIFIHKCLDFEINRYILLTNIVIHHCITCFNLISLLHFFTCRGSCHMLCMSVHSYYTISIYNTSFNVIKISIYLNLIQWIKLKPLLLLLYYIIDYFNLFNYW